MPAERVGDAWVFEMQNIPFPTSNEWHILGTVPQESYHATFSGEVRWLKPVAAVDFQIEMDLDGYDTITGESLDGNDGRAEFNSNLYIRTSHLESIPTSATQESWSVIDQALMDIPLNCELRMRMKTTAPGYSAELTKGRLVLSIITPR